MNDTTEEFRATRLSDVSKLVAAKVAPEQRATLQAFVESYYGQVDPEDLLERQPADLYGAALSHWNFARKRESGRARVRVFNPSIEEHGWQSTHTIVEISNDDMPFLVDSVAMEVNRHRSTIHLIVHPIMQVHRDARGALISAQPVGGGAGASESFIHVEIDRMIETAMLDALAADLMRVLNDVRAAVRDWRAMKDRVLAIIDELDAHAP